MTLGHGHAHGHDHGHGHGHGYGPGHGHGHDHGHGHVRRFRAPLISRQSYGESKMASPLGPAVMRGTCRLFLSQPLTLTSTDVILSNFEKIRKFCGSFVNINFCFDVFLAP